MDPASLSPSFQHHFQYHQVLRSYSRFFRSVALAVSNCTAPTIAWNCCHPEHMNQSFQLGTKNYVVYLGSGLSFNATYVFFRSNFHHTIHSIKNLSECTILPDMPSIAILPPNTTSHTTGQDMHHHNCHLKKTTQPTFHFRVALPYHKSLRMTDA